jgi:hypothetical protein
MVSWCGRHRSLRFDFPPVVRMSGYSCGFPVFSGQLSHSSTSFGGNMYCASGHGRGSGFAFLFRRVLWITTLITSGLSLVLVAVPDTQGPWTSPSAGTVGRSARRGSSPRTPANRRRDTVVPAEAGPQRQSWGKTGRRPGPPAVLPLALVLVLLRRPPAKRGQRTQVSQVSHVSLYCRSYS